VDYRLDAIAQRLERFLGRWLQEHRLAVEPWRLGWMDSALRESTELASALLEMPNLAR